MNISYDTLPEVVSNIQSDVQEIKSLLKKNDPAPKESARVLSSKGAREYISQQGIPMSESRLYKITSSVNPSIPFHRTNNRLLFYANELDEWCAAQIKNPRQNNSASTLSIVKSAQKSINHLKINKHAKQ